MLKLIYVLAGSGLGGILRFVFSRLVQERCQGMFPWGTFVVNVAGCLIIGIIYGLLDRGIHLSEGWKLFLTVGLCGGFTTFSTFMHENYMLFQSHNILLPAAYAALSLFAGLICVYGGYLVVRIV